MKFVKKSDLRFEDGYAIDKDTEEIVALPETVVKELNTLEMDIQHAKYNNLVAAINAKPNIKPFSFKSAFAADATIKEPETPVMDAKIAESLKLIDEIDDTTDVMAYNKWIGNHPKLAEFISKEKFIPGGIVIRLDAITIGNPLELTKDKLFDLIKVLMEG